MRPALKQEAVKNKTIQSLIDSVELPAFQHANTVDRNKILDRLMDFAKSPKTTDMHIVCLLHQGNNSVIDLLRVDQAQNFKIKFLAIIRKLSLFVLERFDITALVTYLISLCDTHAHDEKCLENALIVLQSLVKKPLIDIFCKYDFVSQLAVFATQRTGSVQTNALQILQTQCGFSDNAHACKRVVDELIRIQLLDQLVRVAKIEVVAIFINLYYCSNLQHSVLLFPRVLAMLAQQEDKIDTMPVLLRKACEGNEERLLSVFHACLQYGWFPCFAKWFAEDDTIALLQDFTVLLPGVLDNDDDEQTCMRAMNEVVVALHREISGKSKPADKFWTVFCVLSWGDKGVCNCELQRGINEYQDHFLSSVVLLQVFLDDIRMREGETEDDEEEEERDKTCDLSEPLRAMIFVFKWVAVAACRNNGDSGEVSVQRVLDYVDSKWKRPCEGGIRGLLAIAQQCATSDSQLELVNYCIGCLTAANNSQEIDDGASAGGEAKRLCVELIPLDTYMTKEEEEELPPKNQEDDASTTSFNTQEDPTTITAVLRILNEHRIDFDCALELTPHGFMELGIPGVTYFEFQRWLHDDDDTGTWLAALDCTPRERSILSLQQHNAQCATEAEWVGMGLSSLTWARARALKRRCQRARFTAAVESV